MNITFETPRLLLRPLELSDANQLFELNKNPNVHKYLWQTPELVVDESIKVIEYVKNQYIENKIGRFTTILKDNGEFIGWTGIKFVNDHIENGNTNFYDYGYRLNEKFWNKGYATEATEFWISHAWNEMQIDLLNAYTHSENGASNCVLQKSGFDFMEDYQDSKDITWKWWQTKNPNKK